MQTETALPTAPEATASGQQTTADQLANQTAEDGVVDTSSEAKAEGENEPKAKPEKPEKTEAEREADRLRRAIDRKTRQREEARAEAAQLRSEIERLRSQDLRGNQSRTTIDTETDEPLTLSRAELDQMVKEQAEKLAPTLSQQKAEIEHRTKVIQTLAKEFGQDRFDEIAADLDENMGGLQRNGRATAAAEAIFAAEDPKAVIEYLAQEEHADEAETIGRITDPIRAGRAIAKLEVKLEQFKASQKPQRSKATEPLEASKGAGVISNMPDPFNIKAWMAHANEAERRTRK
jgi:hypothetical protein